MALVTRTLTNAGTPFTSQDGTILAGISITFRLVDNRGKVADAWDTYTGEWVPSEPITVTTDVSGLFSIDLWPTSRATMERYYLCTVDGSRTSRFTAAVMDGPGILTWAGFRNSADLHDKQLSPFVAHVQDTTLHNGINKIILIDAVTGIAYRVVAESRVVKLMELAPGNYGYIDYIIQDYLTGARYRMVCENAVLKLEEL